MDLNLPLPDMKVPVERPAAMSSVQTNALRELQTERLARKIEALRLYCPQPWQELAHKCTAKRRLILGGNRAGKSLWGFAEDARAVTGQDPYDKYPEKNGTLVLVGYNWKHFKTVIVPKLFKSGAFLIIRDKDTGQWRAYDPQRADDLLRLGETKPAPPLIPKRFIKKMNWINKAKGELDSVELVDGWQILCFSSEGQIPQGFDADRVHIDEDVKQIEWVGEMQARCSSAKGVNRAGLFIEGGIFDWTAMPHSKNDALIDMAERADDEAKEPVPRVVKFNPHFVHNYHIPAVEREAFVRDCTIAGEDVVRKRIYGEFTTDSVQMYPSYSPYVHGIEESELEDRSNWCRYMVVDPGHTICAVLFGAVPPDERFVLLEDELYIEHCNAEIFGDRVSEKVSGKSIYEFIIDAHGAALTSSGSGRTPREQYVEALQNRNIRCEATGSRFKDGSDDIPGRTNEVRLWLHAAGSGGPRLRVLHRKGQSALPNFEREIKRYRKQIIDGIVQDKPMQRGRVHLMQTMEMLVAHRPDFHAPRKSGRNESAVMRYWRQKRDKKKPKGNRVLLGSQT